MSSTITPAVRALRAEARQLYKELHHMGKEYPDPNYNFNGKLHKCFAKNIGNTDEQSLRSAIDKANFIKKELEALYFLRKYRAMKNRYYPS